jgi:hypothetical protein
MIPTVAEDDAHSAKINESHARPALAVCARIVPTMEDAADGTTFPMYATKVPWELCPELSMEAMLVADRSMGKNPKRNQ